MEKSAKAGAAGGPRTLAELQNLSKRDPESYRSDFLQQWRHYESNLQIFLLKPTDDAKEFCELVTFVAHLSGCYPKIVAPFPKQIINLLSQHYAVLDSEVRQSLCRALILLRNKELVESLECLEIFFQLFRCKDKVLREMLFSYIVKDIKQLNQKHRQNQMNKKLQNFMYSMLADANQVAAKKSLDVMVTLYQKGVWQDAKTVNVIVTALFSDVGKLKTTALRFFLGGDQEHDEEEEEDNDSGKSYQGMLANTATKKTNKRKKLLKKQLQKEKRKERAANKPEVFNASALHLIHDPQGLADKMFKMLKASKDRWEVQLMVMNLISRLISIHELIVLNFYPYLERYLWPNKQDVTQVLTYVAQACHEYVPPEALESLLMKIANNFVSEKSAPEVMAVGINAIREVCRRCPLAMTEALLQDLAEYKKYKNKAVMTAAKGLIGTFRELNPTLLKKKDRGRPEDDGLLADDGTPLEYGELRASEYVPGLELLTMAEDRAAAAAADGDDDVDDGWVVEEEETKEEDDEDEWSDGSGGWVNVSDDEGPVGDGDHSGPKVEDVVSAEERKRRAIARMSEKPLTQEDFDLIRKLKLERKLMPSSSAKRTRPTDETSSLLLEEDALLPTMKKARQSKEERLASVVQGREERGKFNIRKGHDGGSTNREKEHRKNPMMIKHKRSIRMKASEGMGRKLSRAKTAKKQFRGKKAR